MPRILALLAILAISGSLMVLSDRADQAIDRPFAIRAEPVLLEVANPSRETVDALRYLGGWVLTSDDASFGGISAMAIEGDDFVAVSDAGGVFRFALDDEGRISRAEIAVLPAGPVPDDGGEPQKRDRDAESLAYDPQSGRFWVGFERANGFWRYDAGFTRSDANRSPHEMADWPDNSGAEALVRLADGRFLVFSENGQGPGGSREAFLFASDPTGETATPIRFGYRPPEGYRITDAAATADGRLIILNRRFTLTEGVSVIVSLARLGAIGEGVILEGRTIATLRPPLTIDNMEALAIGETGGRTILWMASDDNFHPLQRTLLLQFELIEAE